MAKRVMRLPEKWMSVLSRNSLFAARNFFDRGVVDEYENDIALGKSGVWRDVPRRPSRPIDMRQAEEVEVMRHVPRHAPIAHNSIPDCHSLIYLVTRGPGTSALLQRDATIAYHAVRRRGGLGGEFHRMQFSMRADQ